MTEKAPKPPVNWKAVELEYRAGIKSLEQIGKEHGVTKGRISQIATRDAWTRDLRNRIQAKADARVNEAAVNEGLNAKQDRLAEKTIVEANAELQYRIRMEHRQDIGRTRKLFAALMDEVELTTDNRALFEELGELMRNPDDNGQDKRNEIYAKVIGMTSRIDSTKKLTEVLEKVIKMEREAFGIDSGESDKASVDLLLKKINSEAA